MPQSSGKRATTAGPTAKANPEDSIPSEWGTDKTTVSPDASPSTKNDSFLKRDRLGFRLTSSDLLYFPFSLSLYYPMLELSSVVSNIRSIKRKNNKNTHSIKVLKHYRSFPSTFITMSSRQPWTPLVPLS